jgi:hypothetical protein
MRVPDIAFAHPGYDRTEPAMKLAHPTRFERVTFAFGGRIFAFALVCLFLQTYEKCPFCSSFSLDAFADRC